MHDTGRGSSWRTCHLCGTTFKTYNAWLRGGKYGRYCSRKCSAKSQPRKAPTVCTSKCLECGVSFSRTKHRAGKMQYCSIGCMSKARGRAMRSEMHPKWNGGSSERAHSVRVAIRIAKARSTGRCEDCGSVGPLHGHHVEPHATAVARRDDVGNIRVLCVPCHRSKHPGMEKFING